jgi:hypothetical protein
VTLKLIQRWELLSQKNGEQLKLLEEPQPVENSLGEFPTDDIRLSAVVTITPF